MDHCLRIPEVVRIVCDGLYGKDAYSMALVARRFVEPALDVRWRTLYSFVPIVKCLPDDLWTVEKGPLPKGGEKQSNNIVLRRCLVRSDLQRYLDHYAHRIRSIQPAFHGYGCTWVSSQMLLAFQVVTGFQAGALSPQLEHLTWMHCGLEDCVGLQAIASIHPCMSQFIGPGLKSIDIAFHYDEDPLYVTTLQSIPQLVPHLKELSLHLGYPDIAANITTLQQYLQASPWEHLESLTITSPEDCPPPHFPSSVIRLLSTLPRLRKLDLQYPVVPSPEPDDPPPSGFHSLAVLQLLAPNLPDFIHFLQHLPPNNVLMDVRCEVELDPYASSESLQLAINTVGNHCHHLALKKLVLKVNEPDENGGEQLDLDEWEGLDISPLLPFNKLAHLWIMITSPIQLTPDLVQQFPIAWPLMTELSLESMFTNSRIPLINHAHFLALLQGLPRLEYLTLRFDATRIKGDEVATGAPFQQLKILDVGDSPLSSPSRVVKFFKANLSLRESPRINEFEDWKIQLYYDRWMAVGASW